MRRAFLVDLTTADRFAKDLEVGGIYISGATVNLDDECHVVLRAGTDEIRVSARVVLVNEEGAGFEIEALTHELRNQIRALVDISKHLVSLERRKTLTRALAESDPMRRRAAGSIAPGTRLGDGRRVAQGSISPIAAFAPTQEDDSLAKKAAAAQIAADDDDDVDD
ncbi:MAG TPA: hypothetical protein VFV99_30895 [Kofleriaceae bacterium]|nr:hypothetical protein [Kofleriaceae bacterium]